jgi:hypothetical protein
MKNKMKNKGLVTAFSLLLSIAMFGCHDSTKDKDVNNNDSSSVGEPSDKNPGLPEIPKGGDDSDKGDKVSSKKFFTFVFKCYDSSKSTTENQDAVAKPYDFVYKDKKFFISKVFTAFVDDKGVIYSAVNPSTDIPSAANKCELITLGVKETTGFETRARLGAEGVRVLAQCYNEKSGYGYYTFERKDVYTYNENNKLRQAIN